MAGFLLVMLAILIWPGQTASPTTEHVQLPTSTISPIFVPLAPTTTIPTVKPSTVTPTTPKKPPENAAGAPIAVLEPQVPTPTPIVPPTVVYVPIYVPVEPVYTPQTTVAPAPTPQPDPTPQPVITNPTPQPMPEEPVSQARIEIVSPHYLTGLTIPHTTSQELNPETQEYSNTLDLGAILYKDDGTVEHLVPMVITATDSSQNKVINNTGAFYKPANAYYYTYHYEFYSPGDHTITFTANGVSKSVTINIAS